jgi:hypothetical protein
MAQFEFLGHPFVKGTGRPEVAHDLVAELLHELGARAVS